MSRSVVWEWSGRGAGLAIGVLAIAAITSVALVAAHVLVLVLISILAAASLRPGVDWVRRRSRFSRAATILAVYALFMASIVVMVLLIVPAALEQVNEISARLPDILADVRAWAEQVEPSFIGAAVERIVAAMEANMARAQLEAADQDMVVSVGVTFAEAAISVVTLLSLTFFWLVGRERIQRFLLAILPARRRAGVRDGWNAVEHRLGLWLRGQVVLMVTIGVATTVAYFVLGLENALLLGLIAGIAEIIPIVGPAIGAIPALISAMISGGPELALMVGVVYVIIQTVEGHVLVPVVMRNAVGLPPFFVIVSLLIGGAVGGLIGALLAVPVAAALVLLLERVQARGETVSIAPGSSTAPERADDAVPPPLGPKAEEAAEP